MAVLACQSVLEDFALRTRLSDGGKFRSLGKRTQDLPLLCLFGLLVDGTLNESQSWYF